MSHAPERGIINSEQTLTPYGYQKNNSKPKARKLWQRVNTNISKESYENLKKDQWDELESPQFVDFAELHEMGDSFFNKPKIIVSTPNVNVQNGSSTNTFNDNKLIECLKSFSLSGINFTSPVIKQCDIDNTNENSVNEYEMNNTVIKVDKKEPEKCNEVKQRLNILTNPFKRPMKCKQENKLERIKEDVEEEKKPWVFRANPVPKYLKSRPTVANENQKLSSCYKKKTNLEASKRAALDDCSTIVNRIWKKPPFVPCPVRKNLKRPKTPPLRTAIRAEQRKQFNNTLKMKELEMQQQRQMELAAKKVQEEREIARLRKQTVHKAQPVPKYKLNLPIVPKRPLTDAVSPLTLKRRRIVLEQVLYHAANNVSSLDFKL